MDEKDMAKDILLFFKLMKTRDILWILFNAKMDNFSEWLIALSNKMQKWGKNA